MLNILFVTDNQGGYSHLLQKLSHRGFSLSFSGRDRELIEKAANPSFDLLLVEIENQQQLAADASIWDNLKELSEQRKLPVILVMPLHISELIATRPEITDFICIPVNPLELEVRVRRCLKPAITGPEIIKSGDMVIDLAQAEVYIGGKPVELTFKEYELLKFLATNKNRVYKREALLNELWGYDYFGGDRTVDVHIRRLRSKIEDADHTFIETVRNIGYKFKTG
jgi:two-component system, OmpR family, alkaline phosphatase synthesis response regulator PhoP